MHRHGAALFLGKEINVENDKSLSRAEKILAELGLDYECSEVGNMSRFVHSAYFAFGGAKFPN